MTTPPASHGTAQEHAVSWLRRLIIEGEFRPGERVRQEDVAARVGLSVAPVREALRVLEQEGQLTYQARRGYFVTELSFADLREIYELRQVLEARAVRHALPSIDDEARERIRRAAADCVNAAQAGDVAAELAANRRFHFEIFDAPDQPHVLRLIQLLWDSTESYRALYYNSPAERQASVEAHDRIMSAIDAGEADDLVEQLDAHRTRALEVLERLLVTPPAKPARDKSQVHAPG